MEWKGRHALSGGERGAVRALPGNTDQEKSWHMDNKELARLLFPDVTLTMEDMEARYPARALPEGACVTRIGPSPTGFVHLGNLYNAIIAERIAHQSGGVFFLRIEDTDNKREVEGAVDIVINAMGYFGVRFDEGAVSDGDKGDYGPYRQRQRREIYHVYAKHLVEIGLAYPCFMTAEELDEIRAKQEANKETTGIYGPYAEASRSLTLEQIRENLRQGKPWVLRYRGTVTDERFTVDDAIRGPQNNVRNYEDFVLLKSDGIPTYHMAHVIDDHLMRSTHIIRGEEWLPSLPKHVELFRAFGWPLPIYCHTATLQKMEGASKRKLSKRKDPELALAYYQQEGICQNAVWEFLLTLLNSNYEEWRLANPGVSYLDFPFSLSKMSGSGALVDLEKLNDVSKSVISAMPADEVYRCLLDWCNVYNQPFAGLLTRYRERAMLALNVGKNSAKPRKDLVNWKQACDFLRFYFDETFQVEDELPPEIDETTRRTFVARYLESYDHGDDPAVWFDKVKALTAELGFAVKPKDYKKNPELYKGSIVHTTNLLRIALTGRANAPDIWEVSHVLGEEIVRSRLEKLL